MNMMIPRSTLHALAPMGLDTPDVESMTSYLCRLAHSHSMAAQTLVEWVSEHFGEKMSAKYLWHQRNFSGVSAECERWAVWLADLTGVGNLDRLTLLPWRHLVGTPGLVPRSDRWCPCCLAEDREQGRDPYLRLAWELAPVEVCHRHKTPLVAICPHCNQGNVRNRSATVVPGYCTACGGFLGDTAEETASQDELWIAGQVGLMLQGKPCVAREGVVDLLRVIIERMAGSKGATFASRYGFSKSGVWHWVNSGGVPGIRAWLTIAMHGGISLDRLFAGDVEDWVVSPLDPQAAIELPKAYRAGIRSRELDWLEIQAQLRAMLKLPTPISINEACERVGVGRKHLYLKANAEARTITDRHSQYRARVRKQREDALVVRIGEVLDAKVAEGFAGLSARDVWERLDEEARSVESVFGLIRQVMETRLGMN
ncbi:TniQ family protein [Bordetella bronchiseptica]|uniref:TniQ family protein n=1 Tax=Bordetella bronchiseptica TaxID=518 RepID=UPI000460EA96|nr:TniQ family protein [Bordetella bronchiseptica]KDC57254.1 protein TniQ [Bordetella bronchiseptica MBORD591]